jgi:hypothetical protein
MTGPVHVNPRLAAALRYAQAGWPVFPCITGEKAPATKHGFLDATTDPDKITWWWSRNPGRNVAIATGTPGPDVLDVDVHKQGSGFAAFNRLHHEGLLDGASAYIRTPSGACTPTSPDRSRATAAFLAIISTSGPRAATWSHRPPTSTAGTTS